MPVRRILLLGDPRLYHPSSPVRERELPSLAALVQDLQDTLLDFHARRGSAKAIAAPQIGVSKRVVYAGEALLNPAVEPAGASEVEVWESCMSFPDLLVKVRRRYACTLTYRDLSWRERAVHLTGEPSVVLQHECDHLNGVLAVAKAVDAESFCLTSQRRHAVLPSQPGRASSLRLHLGEC